MSKRKTLEERQQESDKIHNFEFIILDEPKDCYDKVRVLHKKCGNIINISMNNHTKRYCKYCSKKHKRNKEEWQEESDKIHNNEYTILDVPKNGKIKVKILHKKCNNIFEMSMNNHINHKQKCYCYDQSSKKSNDYYMQKIKEMWQDEYEILESFNTTTEKVKILHKPCGNILEKSVSSLYHDKRGCKHCNQLESFGEKYVEKYFIKNEIEYIKEKTFNNLINEKTNRKLKVDFWLPEQNIAIEIDGIQHYKSVGFLVVMKFLKNKKIMIV